MKNWPEIENCKDKNRREITIRDCASRFEEIGYTLPNELYRLTLVNFLEISGCEITTISNDISLLKNLGNLVLNRNKLKQLPVSICELDNLKVLDISNNVLSELPIDFVKLNSLQTLNLNSNDLSEFPGHSDGLLALSVLDLSNNQFTSLPQLFMCGKHSHLSELRMSHNLIEDVSDGIGMLEALKLLDLSSNEIKELPQAISKCGKLKNADYAGNPLKDRRLKKLIEQKNSSQKAIMDYIKTKGTPPKPSLVPADKSLNGKKNKAGAEDDDSLVKHIMKILRFDKGTPNEQLEVIVTDDVKDVRPYIVCCIVKRLNLSTDNLLRKFLAIQTKLHDGACGKRTVATIASHDVPSLENSKLYYDAQEPDLFSIKPLGRHEQVTALQLYRQLRAEADEMRKERKKNQVTGIYKYLTLLEKNEKFAFLRKSSDDVVISLPPLTNSDGTKMKMGENDILLEVTSAQNLGSCKSIMDKLVQLMINEGLYSSKERDFYSDSSDDENVDSMELPTLVLQQIKELSYIRIPHMLMPDDFKAFSKVKIDNHIYNKDALPSHFKVKEYCPMVFRRIRERFGIDDKEYTNSLCLQQPVRVEDSGRSRARFLQSYDRKFVIKTLQSEDIAEMHAILPSYHQYVVEQGGRTLLPQYIGMYRLTLNNVEHYVIVTRNVMSSTLKTHKKYDLKGSTVQREASEKEKTKENPTFKDNDFVKDNIKIYIGQEAREDFLSMLKRDVEFLASLKLMDYSLLVGIHDKDREDRYNDKLEMPADNGPDQEVSPLEDDNDSPKNVIYFMGLIDILTHYDAKKKAAHAVKTAKHGSGAEISTVKPFQYSKRFLEFISDHMVTPSA